MSKSQAIFYLSIIMVIMAAISTLGVSLWLAATQWLIMAAVLGIWAIYFQQYK